MVPFVTFKGFLHTMITMTVRSKGNTSPEEVQAMHLLGSFIKYRRETLNDVGLAEHGHHSRAGFILDTTTFEDGSRAWISEKSLANIENGQNMPSLPTLYRLATALQMSPEDLFSAAAAAFILPKDKAKEEMKKYMPGSDFSAEDDADDEDWD